jgi:hypothetical protein
MLVGVILASALSSAPAPVGGDFDHDGKADLAQIVPGKHGLYQLVIRRGAGGHPVSVIVDDLTKDQLGDLFLARAKPGRWRTWCGKGGGDDSEPCLRKSVRLRGDTLSFGTREASEAIALWIGRKFEVVWMSD